MKYTTKSYIDKCINIHGNKYDYSLVEYLGSIKKVKIICKIHGIFEQLAFCHIQGQNCSKCHFDKKKKGIVDFILKCDEIHNNTYNYTLVKFENRHDKIDIMCSKHGIFNQRAADHLRGRGCPYCYKSSLKKENEVFIKEASKIHNNKYKYIGKYDNAHKYIDIECPEHGIFKQKPYSHLNGQGCMKCQYESYDTESFIKKSNEMHNYFYKYDDVVYINGVEKVNITCPKHGNFKQTPNSHSQGQGCPRCSSLISKYELKWLDSIGVGEDYRQFKIGRYRVDGFDPKTNTIYEFYGDYWHGNPKKYKSDDINKNNKIKFGDLYTKTIKRENLLKDNGYNIISIWELDFKNNI